MDATDPLPFFVIQHILSDIATDWEGRPLPVDEAESLESRLRGLINEVIEARQAGASPEEMYNHLNALVIAFLASPT
ncbi:MAG: hypothetical protein ISS53_00380 [Dehalococcoidia bacterium]|nr:hypothetical protein [Dehalococcoidia bacterium]